MTIHTIPKETIDRLTSTALNGDCNTAFAVLHQSGLNEAQKAKIAAILKAPRSDMEQRIVAVVGEENIASPAASSQATPSEQIQCISFSNASTSPFGIVYPCAIEFGGKHYQNAAACILAQGYINQPEIMDLFADLSAEEAFNLAKLTPVTKKRKRPGENPQPEQINRDDVLMNVLRAKFEQNPDLKNQLLDTEGAYLVCRGHGLYFSDNFNGSGRNALGVSLMRLRGEFGGAGQVAPPTAYNTAMQSLQTSTHSVTNELYTDIIGILFNRLLSQGHFKTLSALPCVSRSWNNFSTNFWAGCDLKQVCPELTILDAKAQGVQCDDEPKISKLRLLAWFREMSPHVEGNAGVTLLTMTKGTTLKQLIKIAKGEGMTVDVLWKRIIPALGDVPVEQTYGILISNSVFTNSRNEGFNLQKILVEGHRCQMPTVQEYIALCVYTNKVFKKCLYGQNPSTFGRSSTHVENLPLVVGGSTLARLDVSCNSYAREFNGAGGRRKY